MASLLGLYDHDYTKFSLDTYTMLKEAEYGRRTGPVVLPGYILDKRSDFDYKLKLGPMEHYNEQTVGQARTSSLRPPPPSHSPVHPSLGQGLSDVGPRDLGSTLLQHGVHGAVNITPEAPAPVELRHDTEGMLVVYDPETRGYTLMHPPCPDTSQFLNIDLPLNSKRGGLFKPFVPNWRHASRPRIAGQCSSSWPNGAPA